MPEFKAKKYSRCPVCERAIRPGQSCRKLFDESRKTAHAWCVGKILSDEHKEDPDYVGRVSDFRKKVKSVRCPKCGADPGDDCRSLGTARESVHRQRVHVWRSPRVV